MNGGPKCGAWLGSRARLAVEVAQESLHQGVDAKGSLHQCGGLEQVVCVSILWWRWSHHVTTILHPLTISPSACVPLLSRPFSTAGLLVLEVKAWLTPNRALHAFESPPPQGQGKETGWETEDHPTPVTLQLYTPCYLRHQSYSFCVYPFLVLFSIIIKFYLWFDVKHRKEFGCWN